MAGDPYMDEPMLRHQRPPWMPDPVPNAAVMIGPQAHPQFTNGDVPQQREIHAELHRLEKAVVSNRELGEHLHQRLDGVMAPAAPEPGCNKSATGEPMTKLGNHLRSIVGRIEEGNAFLARLLDRLQL